MTRPGSRNLAAEASRLAAIAVYTVMAGFGRGFAAATDVTGRCRSRQNRGRAEMAEPVCVVPAGDWTGEGAVWHADEQALYWVDINRFLIHRFDPEAGDAESWFFTEPPTALGLTDRADTLVVALASKVILWQPRNDARADFAMPEKRLAARPPQRRPARSGRLSSGSARCRTTSPTTAATCRSPTRPPASSSAITAEGAVQRSRRPASASPTRSAGARTRSSSIAAIR